MVDADAIEKAKLKNIHGELLKSVNICLDDCEDFSKVFHLYENKMRKEFPNVLRIKLKQHFVEILFRKDDEKDGNVLIKDYFNWFTQNFYPCTEHVIENVSSEVISYIQINKKKLSEAYYMLISIDDGRITLKGPRKTVESFISFKDALVCENLHVENVQLAEDFLLNRNKELLEVSAGIDDAKQLIAFCGEADNVKFAISYYERYMKATRLSLLVTKIDERNSFIENMLLKNEKFYKYFTREVSQYLGGDFVEVSKKDDNTILITSERNVSLSEDEQNEQVNRRLLNCINRIFNVEKLEPLLSDSQVDVRFQSEISDEIKKLLMSVVKISHNEVHFVDLIEEPVQFLEYQPRTFYVLQKSVKYCYALPSYDISGALQVVINSCAVHVSFQNYYLMIQHKDFIRLFEAFKTKSEHNKVVEICADEYIFEFSGHLVDIAYLKAWIDYFIRKSFTDKVLAPDPIDFNEHIELIHKIMRHVGIDLYYFHIDNNQWLKICTLDKSKLDEALGVIRSSLFYFKTEIKTYKPLVVEYLKEHRLRIENMFYYIVIEIMSETEVKIQGDTKELATFVEYVQESIIIADLDTEFVQFYENFGREVDGVMFKKTANGYSLVGEAGKIHNLIWIKKT